VTVWFRKELLDIQGQRGNTPNMKMSVKSILLGGLQLLAIAYSTECGATPTLRVCINVKTGATSVKSACTPKKEVIFTPESVLILGGNGLNVYDSKGHVVGPLIGINETIVTIAGKKYWAPFNEGSIGMYYDVRFNGQNCTGTAYAQADTTALSTGSPSQYSGIGTLVVVSAVSQNQPRRVE
jgi:hypothetical protein